MSEEQKKTNTSFLEEKYSTKLVIVSAIAFLVIGLMAGMTLMPATGLVVASENDCVLPLDDPAIDMAELENKVQDYINTNFLTAGVTSEIESIEEFNDSLYKAEVSILAEGELVDQVNVYMTNDGAYLVLGEVFDLSENLPQPEAPAAPEIAKTDKPEVDLFVMSFCPYGQQAVDGFLPVQVLLDGKIDFEPHYIHYEASMYAGQEDTYCMGDYCAMHGVDELLENVRQLCVWRDQQDAWVDYVNYVNTNCSLQDISECWTEAAEVAGVDIDAVNACLENDAMDILAAEKALTDEKGVRGSPSMFINGTAYQGYRTPEAFKGAVCSGFNTEPEECAQTLEETTQALSGSC